MILPFRPLLAAALSAPLVTFLLYTLAVFGIAIMSNRFLKGRNFLSEYFLGSRSLGVWAFAMTFAATSASGGSFTGFPSKIYSHGWVLALWIGSYIVVPICVMGLLGKRINQVARISGAITVPDVIRDRFNSRILGLVSVVLIVFFMSINLIAQFKAGSLILKTLLQEVPLFNDASLALAPRLSKYAWLSVVDPEYLICLVAFGCAVIAYTTFGGFRAVVWTDVMQGVVMIIGVLILLPLALQQVGGLEHATREMSKMTPPQFGTARIAAPEDDAGVSIPAGTWVLQEGPRRLFRTTKIALPGDKVDIMELTTSADIDRFLESDRAADIAKSVALSEISLKPPAFPIDPTEQGSYVSGPGPDQKSIDGFLPLSLAISFFFMWAISGAGQPSNMVRLMAFRDTATLRRSILTVAIYYSCIYFPLVVIFCCARVLLPGMDYESDRIMPAMAMHLTSNIGAGWLAGVLVAAPFAAVMSTVDSFLLMISSAVVRDIYQRNLNTNAREKTIRTLSYLCTLFVGSAAMVGAVNPPQFLQDVVVYTGSGLAASFLAPVVFALYWPRANVQGALAGMLCGYATHLLMYLAGIGWNGSFFLPYRPLNFDPLLIALVVSFAATWWFTRRTAPPPTELVEKYFHRTP